MLTDNFNRIHDYLRISLTDACNFRCVYCMPEHASFMPSVRLMQRHEIFELAQTFVKLGVRKIRLTGGEPLVRKDVADIMGDLAGLPVELTLTTNGFFIREHIKNFKNLGIRSINVSLDTLQAEKFQRITRRNVLHQVMDGINLLLKNNIHVKINAVAMKGVNDDEINDFIEWTRNSPVHVRFIEFMPFNGNNWQGAQVLPYAEILGIISEKFSFEKLGDDAHDTAKKYHIPGHKGTFAVISTMSEPFCGGCNRLRLTADGKVKNCLFSKGESDLLSALRSGDDVEQLIRNNLRLKFERQGGQLDLNYRSMDPSLIENRSMVKIGG